MRMKKLKITVVPVLIAVAILLFGIIMLAEKPALIPVSKPEKIIAEGGAGDYFLPKDPELQVAAFAKLYEIFKDTPEKLEAYPVSWGFARDVSEEEKAARMKVVDTAKSWLGVKEEDGSHQPVVDIYNSHEPLARGYAANYEDSWCSIFVSTVSIQCGLTDKIPTECGCEPHIELFKEMGCWEEADDYLPLPGDLVFYHWECTDEGDCVSRSDHVGIVVGTAGDFIKVIEGNYGDAAGYHLIWVDHSEVRGYALPNYA
ncbi:MAG: CHAP domain-containing protein [Oscillospiraceae bacterium]|nr:CHAP domain-containing protein [Oscillospiraceae bacterium]